MPVMFLCGSDQDWCMVCSIKNNNNNENLYSTYLHIQWMHRALYNSDSNTYTPSHTHTCVRAHTYACTRACTHTHTHMHTHAHHSWTTETRMAVENTNGLETVLEKLDFKSGYEWWWRISDRLTKADCSRQMGRYKRMIFRCIVLCFYEA